MLLTPTVAEAYKIIFEQTSGKKPADDPKLFNKFLKYSATLTVSEARDIVAKHQKTLAGIPNAPVLGRS